MNKKVAFHSEQLGFRGTEIALYDYAHYNETILGNESYIIAPKNSDLSALDKFKNRFEDRIYLYDEFTNANSKMFEWEINYAYYIKSGLNDGKIGSDNLIA